MSPKKITLPLDIYVRVSDVKGREGDSFISPTEQANRCRAAAAARGLEVGAVLEELNVSGGKMDRPRLNEAIERIREGVSGGIVVARIDRFGRTVVGALQTLEEVNEAGGVVITAEGDFDTSTAVGELVLNMMLSLAQFELRRIRDNWQVAKGRAVERGVHIAPRIPQGYLRGEDGRLILNGKSSETIRAAFVMAASGDTYSMIASYLNERELPTWGGDGVWQPNRIKRLLANRVYLGEARSGNGHVNPDAHPALVDAVTFAKAQRASVSPTLAAPHKDSEPVATLAGLVRCASCRFAMKYQKARQTPAGSEVVAIYRCPKHSVHGTCTAPSSITADKLEAYVIDALLARAEINLEQASDDDEGRTEAVEAALEAERVFKAWLTNTEMQSALGADYDARLLALRQAWDEAKAAIPSASGAGSMGGTVSLAELVDALKEAGDVLGLRELVSTAVQAVMVRPAASRSNTAAIGDRVRIVWNDEPALDLPKRGTSFEPRPYIW